MWRNIGVTWPKPTRDDTHTKFQIPPRYKQSSASRWQLITKADELRGRNMGRFGAAPFREDGSSTPGWRCAHPHPDFREPIAGRMPKTEP
jgi:hypothetical protein